MCESYQQQISLKYLTPSFRIQCDKDRGQFHELHIKLSLWSEPPSRFWCFKAKWRSIKTITPIILLCVKQPKAASSGPNCSVIATDNSGQVHRLSQCIVVDAIFRHEREYCHYVKVMLTTVLARRTECKGEFSFDAQ